jgi:hypothetical protein
MEPTTSSNTNVLPALKTPSILYALLAFIVLLIVVLICFMNNVPNPFKGRPSKSTQEAVADTLVVLCFILLVVGICIALLPNLKEVKNLFEQISNVTYVVIYTIGLILFFMITPGETINKYAHIIAPITLIGSALMFYLGAAGNYVEKFNVNYERIKTMILMFCLITTFIIYYNADPGGYIQKYFGYSLLLTIIIAVFAFLYLIVLLTLPDKVVSTPTGSQTSNFLDNFTKLSTFSSIGFLLFIIVIAIVIAKYPGGFFNDKEMAGGSMVIVLLICILWSIVIGGSVFSDVGDNSVTNGKLNIFKRSLLVLFGIVISGLIIAWVVYNVQHFAGKSGIVSLVLNLLVVILVLGLIYKTVVVRLPAGNANKNAFFSMIMNTIFYIPCFFSGLFDNIGNIISGKADSNTMGSLLMVIVASALLVAYYYTPSVFNIINTQGGTQLVNKPVYTNSVYSLGTYQDLNGTDNFEYQYAISFWVFLDASPPNTNQSYSKYTSLLNFGNKPNVLYKGDTNTLKIVMNQKDLSKITNNKLTDFDEDGNRVIYTNDNVLLQKWNNIIINYSGGVLDIFLNGDLVKSSVGVVPYYTIDNLTIGEENGINGGICNVVYFKRALNASNIYYLYNMVKNRTPPVLNDSNKTILAQNIDQVNSSIKAAI